jgi:hypothetical protein
METECALPRRIKAPVPRIELGTGGLNNRFNRLNLAAYTVRKDNTRVSKIHYMDNFVE